MRKNWTDFYKCQDPNQCWKTLFKEIVSSLDEHCTINNFNVKTVSFPWINRDALEMIRDKDSALSRAKRTNKKEDWDAAKQLRNRVGLAIQNMKGITLKMDSVQIRVTHRRNLKTVVPGKTKQTEKIDLRIE